MPEDLNFRDDGNNGDALEGDGEYTLGPFFLRKEHLSQDNLPHDVSFGRIQVVGEDDVYSTSIIETTLGVLPSGFKLSPVIPIREDAQLTSHLLNVSKDGFSTQEWFRGVDTELLFDYLETVYEIVEDDYDFIILLSSGRLERVYEYLNRNSVSGMGLTVQAAPFVGDWDQSDFYSSDGTLQALCALDYQSRGMIPSTLVHEMLHRWAAYFDTSLEVRNPTAHYEWKTNAASLLGGNFWEQQEDGTYLVDGSIGRGGAYRASPVDLFSMGLIPPEDLPDLLYAPTSIGNVVRAEDIKRTVTAEDILNAQKPHAPNFENPQKRFRILFVIESKGRLLTETEMNYYNAFVAEAMRILDPLEEDPYVSNRWVPITRFFGDSVSWNPSIALRPAFYDNGLDHDGDGISTMLEVKVGTNAFSKSSKPRVWLGADADGVSLNVSPPENLDEIELESSSDLETWIPFVGDFVRAPDDRTSTVPLESSQFVRSKPKD
ncbi:hypothetical protein JIN87_11720 [Pelagicoccus mobilis]|uniref:Uncharacterized protein n=2 Tax=Pelagicoccus mobilis TaxID=415221 RepID=A0A934S152_9BACT|nr:hypothetical protein [Pelagicoccus mobilis]